METNMTMGSLCHLYIGVLVGQILLLGLCTQGFLVSSILPHPLECNFEKTQCGFNTSASSSGMEWSRLNVALGHTFLNTDSTFHSKGQGYVMFVNGKASRHSDDLVKFQSKTVRFPMGSHIAVGFSYIFSELHTNPMTLSVYIRSGNKPSMPIWTKTGHVSTAATPRWHRNCITSSVSGEVTVIFEAKVSHSVNNGDLAIDDVVIEPGNRCHSYNHVTPSPQVTQTTHTNSSVASVTCTFDLSSICGYVNRISGDNFNWNRHQLATQSIGTGPIRDHTSGRGFYMYLETSSPRHQGEIARIDSPQFTSDGHQRLSFWYNAYGNGIGSLKVYLETNGILGSPVFVMTKGTNTSIWQRACLQINKQSSNMKVVFEGVVGKSYQGDIAIDDVILDHGDCKSGVDPTILTVTLNFGHWLAWGSWSSCSHTCGVSSRHRTRNCSSSSCDGGQSSQTLLCHTNTCPGLGHWLSWGSWSSCSHSCGISTKHRMRKCSSNNCESGQNSQSLLCHTNACSAPGKSIVVTYLSINSIGGTFYCIKRGTDTTYVTYSTKVRQSVSGGWSHWTTWSKCSTSCDLGTISRSRSCSNPAPTNGGTPCSGNNTEMHECSVGPCPSWSIWYDGKCSSSCGNGTMERIRTCSTGTSSDCTGGAKELIQCVGSECI